jgi:RNA polymerase sigma-70 factor (ECF subfamily)
MDQSELARKILDKKIDSQKKYAYLWEYYYPRLLLYIKSFKKISDSEYHDIVSEVLLKIFSSLYKYNEQYSLSTWVYAVAKNYILDVYRKNKKRGLLVSDEELDGQAISGDQNDFIETILQKDIAEKCRHYMESLQKRDRRILFLRYYEGLNAKEIAAIEGMSHSTVRQRLMVVKARIRKFLGGEYEN